VLALGKDEIRRATFAFPWIWSKHFGQGEPFHVIRDHGHLRNVLVQEPECERSISMNARHPALGRALHALRAPRHVALTGAPGTGKTIGLFQLAMATPERVIIVMRPTCLDRTSVQIVQRLIGIISHPLTLILDDLHQQCDLAFLHTTLGQLALCIDERQRVRGDMLLLTAHWSTAHERIVQQYSSFEWTTFSDSVSLDGVRDDSVFTFYGHVARQLLPAYGIEADEGAVGFVTRFAWTFDSTVRGMVDYVRRLVSTTLGSSADVFPTEPTDWGFWRARFAELPSEEQLVLHVIGTIAVAGGPAEERSLIGQVCEELGLGGTRFDSAVSTLDRKGWIRNSARRITWHMSRRSAVAIVSERGLHPAAARVAAAILSLANRKGIVLHGAMRQCLVTLAEYNKSSQEVFERVDELCQEMQSGGWDELAVMNSANRIIAAVSRVADPRTVSEWFARIPLPRPTLAGMLVDHVSYHDPALAMDLAADFVKEGVDADDLLCASLAPDEFVEALATRLCDEQLISREHLRLYVELLAKRSVATPPPPKPIILRRIEPGTK
jgi:hypothetical protein